MTEQLSYDRKVKIYKPSRSSNGGAVQFDFNPSKKAVFVEAANQTGEQAFDWANKIVFKLSVQELAKLCVVFDGRSQKVDLFHVPSKSKFVSETNVKNSTLSIIKANYGFFFKLSTQDNSGKVKAIQVPLSDDEALLLSTLFKVAISKVYGW